MIEVILSLIGQKVKMISPKIDMKRTIGNSSDTHAHVRYTASKTFKNMPISLEAQTQGG